MGARRRSTSELPHAPLQMVHPAALPGAGVSGAEIVRELPSDEGVLLYSLFRTALAWSTDFKATDPELAHLEAHALSRLDQEGFWAAVAILAGQLAGGRPVEHAELAQACFCIADWALARNARATALAYTLLAALLWPRHPRYAWAVGRMLRGQGRMREAEFWLRRSHRVAVWTGDAYAQSLSLSSLGMLSYTAGNHKKAERRFSRALVVANRHGLRVLEGEILHNFMILEMARQDYASAEGYVSQVLERYLPDHERLPALAHDIACLWMDQGYFDRALELIRAVPSRIDLPAEKFQAFCAAVRAAGGAGDEPAYRWAWSGAVETRMAIGASARAGALFDMGRGAWSLGQWEDAISAFEATISAARARGESDMLFKAEAALEVVRRREGADSRHIPEQPRRPAPTDANARDVIRVLQPALCA